MKIAIIGTDGIPARYGGFETFVQEVTPYLVKQNNEIIIVGSSLDRDKTDYSVRGIKIINIPLSANGVWSIPFDILSFLRVFYHVDAIILLGVSAGIFTPLFKILTKKRRLVVNVDGLESRREKWKGFRKSFLALSERIAVRSAPIVISDNQGIADILSNKYKRTTIIVAYGSNHVNMVDVNLAQDCILENFDLEPESYALTIARIEPENNIETMIEAFLLSGIEKYVIVGNFETTVYGKYIAEKYSKVDRITMINSIYDSAMLASLRKLCKIYLHGHSVGGTNPSLVEMLPYSRPVVAWDCIFNRYTLQGQCGYFKSFEELEKILKEDIFARYIPGPDVVNSLSYRWDHIANQYIEAIQSI